MRPAGFYSWKFNPAQVNYATHEQEILVVIETLMKYEDKLLGCKFVVVTSHRSLEFFQTQSDLSWRQVRCAKYLGRFDFHFQYIGGKSNVVSDALLRYHKENTSSNLVPPSRFVTSNCRLDKEGKDLPRSFAMTRASKRSQPVERQEPRIVKSEALNAPQDPVLSVNPIPALSPLRQSRT